MMDIDGLRMAQCGIIRLNYVGALMDIDDNDVMNYGE